MKKNAMRRNLRQSIVKSFGRYLAIVMIIALGSGLFVGLLMTKTDMVATGQSFMDEQNMFDLRLMNSYGWTEDYLDEIAAMDGVVDVEAVSYLDLIVRLGEGEEDSVYRFLAMPQTVNRVALRGGRMPEAPNEILMDGFYADDSILGTKVTVRGSNEADTLTSIKGRTFTVVGYVATPLYMDMNRGTTSVGSGSLSGFFYVPEGVLEMDYIPEINVTIAGDYAIYSDAYNDALEAAADALEPQLQILTDRRLKEAREEAEEAYRDGKKEFEDGVRTYHREKKEAHEELDEALDELEDAQKQIERNEKLLTDGEKQIVDGRELLAESEITLAESRSTYLNARADAYQQMSAYSAEMMQSLSDATNEMTEVDNQILAIDMELLELDAAIAQVWSSVSLVDTNISSLETMIGIVDINISTLEQQLEMMNSIPGMPDTAAEEEEEEDTDQIRAEMLARLEELKVQRAEYEAQLAELQAERQQYENELSQLNDQRAELAAQRQLLEDQRALLTDKMEQAGTVLMQISVAQSQMDSQFAAAEAQLDAGENKIKAGYAELELREQQIKDGWVELEKGKEELADGWIEYTDGRIEAEQAFYDAWRELKDAEAELADAREMIDGMTENEPIILDRNSNVGYNNLDSASDIVQGVSRVFPVFFLLVASLVCITTMTRMIDEERTQIGTLKALGYSNSAIISKYLFYSGSGAVIGCGMGVLVGSSIFPMILWEAYKIMLYIKPGIVLTINWALCLIVVGVYTAVLLFVTWYCCRRTLQEVPAELIRPKAPDAGKALLVERLPFWHKISFLNKVTIRNIFRYRQRLAMMLVGIGGCTALLVTGFGLRDSIVNVVDVQFEDVTRYDLQVYFQEDVDDDARTAFLEELKPGMESMFYHQSSVELEYDNRIKDIYMMSAGDELTNFIDLHAGGAAVALPGEDEVVLTVGVAEALGIDVGDQVRMRNSDLKTLELTVSGIYDNHVYNYSIVHPDTIAKQWGYVPQKQMAFIRLAEGQDVHATAADLSGLADVMNVAVSEDLAGMVRNMMDALDLVVVVIVFCAGLLAAIVLYNLTNININERIREIATIKVLGFNAAETGSYVFKENMTLTVVGSVAGLGLGYLLLLFVMTQIKIDMVWFKAMVLPMSYVYSIVLTILAAIIVDFIFYFKLQKINMAEALKSVE